MSFAGSKKRFPFVNRFPNDDSLAGQHPAQQFFQLLNIHRDQDVEARKGNLLPGVLLLRRGLPMVCFFPYFLSMQRDQRVQHTFPGLRMRFGSNTRLMPSIRAMLVSPTDCRRYSILPRPMPCSPETSPPQARA